MQIRTYRSLPPDARLIREEVFMAEQGFENEFEQLDEHCTHLVGYEGDEPVATCRLIPDEDGDPAHAVFGRLAVRRAWRGRGLGAEMLAAAEREAARAGATRMRLHAQEQVRGFYEKAGYAVCGPREFDEGVPHLWMERTLSAAASPSDAVREAASKAAARATDTVRRSRSSRGHRLVGYTRFMALIPSFGLLVAAIALTIATLVSTVSVTIEVVEGHLGMQDMLVEYIEFADFFLLSIVLYIMAIGIYSLFVDDQIEMPSWLEIHTLDDLKEKLVSVIVVVMGVFFLGRLIHGAASQDLLCMGVGIGAVILSLAYFVRHVMVAHKFVEQLADRDDKDEAHANRA